MKTVRGIAAAVALFALAAPALAQDKAAVEKKLQGKWKITQKVGDMDLSAVLEFAQGGKLNLNMKTPMGDFKADGTYKVLDADNVEITLTFMGQTKTEKSKVKVTDDSLELTDPMNKTEKFTKVKDK
jgi:uncharacterized protein (TIGR03066 family)